MKKLLKVVVNDQNETVLQDASGEYEILDATLLDSISIGEFWLVDETEEGIELLNVACDTVYIEEEHGLVEYRLDSEPTLVDRETAENKDVKSLKDYNFDAMMKSIDILNETFKLGHSTHVLGNGIVIETECVAKGNKLVRKCIDTDVVQVVQLDTKLTRKVVDTSLNVEYEGDKLVMGKNNILNIEDSLLSAVLPDMALVVNVTPNTDTVYATMWSQKIETPYVFPFGKVNGEYVLGDDQKIIPPMIETGIHPTLLYTARNTYEPLPMSHMQELVLNKIQLYIKESAEPDMQYVWRTLLGNYKNANGSMCSPFYEEEAKDIMFDIDHARAHEFFGAEYGDEYTWERIYDEEQNII